MPNYNVTNNIDTLLRSTTNAAARTNLGLGDAATKNTGTAAGTVAAGDDSRIAGALQTSGGTMTGRIIAAADNSIAKISLGARTTGSSPTALVDGDIWISNQGALSYRDSTGPASRAVASLSLKQTFNQPQTVAGTMNADPALTVSNTGTREVVTISNTATATSDAVVITNLGSGNSLVVNDETTPDSTRFAVANNGRVGIGVAPDASVALAVDSTGIKFSDNSVQTTAGLTGTVGIANGGTGQTTQQAAINALAGATTSGQYLRGNGTNVTLSAIQAADVPTLNQNTTGTANNVTGTVAIANGGTGQTTQQAAINALLPTQTGNNGKVLSTDGTNTSWTTAGGSGTVTSITAGTGLTGGTITTSGTVAADFGTTTGKVTEGGTTVLKAGDTMTGKLNLTSSATTAPINLGGDTSVTTPANGDIFIQSVATGATASAAAARRLAYVGGDGSRYVIPTLSTVNTFTAAQGVTATSSGTILSATQTAGSGTAIAATQGSSATGSGLTVDINNVASTATAVRITNQGTGASLVVEDQASVDPTPFTVSNTGKVGVGVAPDAVAALSVDVNGIKFSDGTIQTTAGGAGGVSSFSAGTTGLSPSTSTTGAVTLAGTLSVANGGTGATTLTGIVKGSGTSPLSVAVAGTDYVAPNGNITGTAGNVTGTVAIANGGTGQTTAANAINALVPAQSGQSGKVLTTDGSVVSWGTAGGSGITALTGDVSASGSGSVSASVTGLRGRVVATTAPTAGQVLGWNGTTNEWEPTSAGGAVSYDVLRVFITGPSSGTYIVPSGYKYADIYAAGAGGGGGSGQYVSSGVGYGGGGGTHGIFGRRQKLGVENASINYELSAGGSGGVPDAYGNGANGTGGAGTLVYFSVTPTSGSSSSVILDCGYYINNGAQSNTFGYSGQSGGTAGQLSLFSTWPQNIQNGGVGGFAMAGAQPQLISYSLETFNISAGAGGGGINTGTTYDGGNILDLNYMLYTSGVHQVFNGIPGSSGTIDATPVPLVSGQNIFWGGAGGASADVSSAIYTGAFHRAGNGANGGYGCGGGGGGAIYDPANDPSNYRPGSGGNGGAGFLLMYLYK